MVEYIGKNATITVGTSSVGCTLSVQFIPMYDDVFRTGPCLKEDAKRLRRLAKKWRRYQLQKRKQ